MKKIIAYAIILMIFSACNIGQQVTLKGMKNYLEALGDYEISEHYMPSELKGIGGSKRSAHR